MNRILITLAMFSAFSPLDLAAAEIPQPVKEGVLSAPEPGVVGLAFKQEGNRIIIERIAAATPASRQTVIRVGDEIQSIAQEDEAPVMVTGMTLGEVSALVRGNVGSKISIGVLRAGRNDEAVHHATFTREPIPESAFNPGDPAPAWRTGPWIKGEPVTAFDPDKVYLIECWATWCGPCVAGIPHLNELHLKYKEKGLVVIGQNIWQKDEKVVRKFVESMGDRMSYRVAMDDIAADDTNKMPKGAVSEAWIQPDKAYAYGVHTAFLVGKDARIAWSGNPSNLTEAMIETALAAPAGSRGTAK